MIDSVKYLIIGGGVSGLMFANKVRDDYLLLEKENELGGFCRTIYQDGFTWDYAGHFFHFANEEIKRFFKDKLAEEHLIHKNKNTKIFYGSRVIDFPFQANIHQLERSDFLDCLYDLYFKDEREQYPSFLAMLYGKFGASITEKFLKPYNEKLYACDLSDLDQDAMGRFFPYVDFGQVIKGFKEEYKKSYNSTFMYPKGGAKVFVDALAKDIDKERVALCETVVNIDAQARVVETDKRQIKYETLVNTAPFPSLLDLIGQGGDSQSDKYSWNKVLVLNLGFDKKSSYQDLHWAYFPEEKYNFYRVGFYDNILGEDRLSLYVEIGYSSGASVDVSAELDKTLQGLAECGIVSDHKLVSYSPILMNPAYVHVDAQLDVVKNEIKDRLRSYGIHTIGRYGDWKYCSIEDSMLDAVRLFEELSRA